MVTARRNPAGRASLPPVGYQRPALLNVEATSVRVVGESGEDNGTYDFSGLDAPAALIGELVASFARRPGSGGTWRSRASAVNGAAALRRFVRHLAQLADPPQRIEEIAPHHWNDYRAELRAVASWPQITTTRSLLAGTEGLGEKTRHAMARPILTPRRRREAAYSLAEFRRIRTAAWQTVNSATARIRAGVSTLAAGGDGATAEVASAEPGSPTAAEVLATVARIGRLPDVSVAHQGRLRA